MVCLPLIAEQNAHKIFLTQQCLQIVRRLLWKQTTTHSIRNNNPMFDRQPPTKFFWGDEVHTSHSMVDKIQHWYVGIIPTLCEQTYIQAKGHTTGNLLQRLSCVIWQQFPWLTQRPGTTFHNLCILPITLPYEPYWVYSKIAISVVLLCVRYLLCSDQGLPFGDCLLLSASLHRLRKAAVYAVPTATAPLCGLLHCSPCVARLKEGNNHQMADPGSDQLNQAAQATGGIRKSKQEVPFTQPTYILCFYREHEAFWRDQLVPHRDRGAGAGGRQPGTLFYTLDNIHKNIYRKRSQK